MVVSTWLCAVTRSRVLFGLAVVVGVVSVACERQTASGNGKPSGAAEPSATSSAPEGDALGLESGWQRLATIPADVVSPADDATPNGVVWTGTELVIWDGFGNSGVAFDARSDRWRALPESPLAPRAGVVMVSTGEEVLVWGGSANFAGGGATPYTDGAAYDPETDHWRPIPEAPIAPRLALGGVWTGDEFIVAGGPPRVGARAASPEQVLRDGAAYDPTANTWRKIAPAPIPITEGVVRWTGNEMLVFGSLRTDFPDAQDPIITNARAALYDPTDDTWRRLPPSGIGGVGPVAAVTGHQIVAIDPGLDPRRYELRGADWHDAGAGLDARYRECYVTLSAASDEVLLSQCGNYWSFDTTTQRWLPIPSPTNHLDESPWGEPIWTGRTFLYWQTNPWLPDDETAIPTADASRKDLIVWAYTPTAPQR